VKNNFKPRKLLKIRLSIYQTEYDTMAIVNSEPQATYWRDDQWLAALKIAGVIGDALEKAGYKVLR